MQGLPLHSDLTERNSTPDKQLEMQPRTSRPIYHLSQPPLRGRPVNNLPPEILSWIFVIGEQMYRDGALDEEKEGDDDDQEEEEKKKICTQFDECLQPEIISNKETDSSGWEDKDDKDDEDDKDKSVSFRITVCHVCQYWRRVAIETASLWNIVDFSEGQPYEKTRVYLERSKSYPLIIDIDTSRMDPATWPDYDSDLSGSAHSDALERRNEDLEMMLGIIAPHAGHWAEFILNCSEYKLVYTALTILSAIQSAPLLETLEISHRERGAEESAETFSPVAFKTPFVLFNNDLPKLQRVALWGVHIDWANTRFLKNLIELDLTYHARDVRPTFQDFFNIFRASKFLFALKLCSSGPAGVPSEWPKTLPPCDTDSQDPHVCGPANAQFEEFLTLGSLRDLNLGFHPPEYIMAILDRLYMPNLRNLSLDFKGQDHSEFVEFIASPRRHGGSKETIVDNVVSLKLVQLPCTESAARKMFEKLKKLQTLNLNLYHLDDLFWDLLSANPTSEPLLPSLVSLAVSGGDASRIQHFVDGRRAAGLPLKVLSVDKDTVVDGEHEFWFHQNVERFSYFFGFKDETGLDDDDLDNDDLDDDDLDDDDLDDEEPMAVL